MTILRTASVIPNRPLIELQNVSRRFELRQDKHRSFQDSFIRLFRRIPNATEEFWPLRDVSLTVYPGDCVGVIGVNGSGKSTMLKLICGILPPTSGDLSVHGRVSSLLELGAGFHPDLTGRENVYLNGSIYGMSRAQMDKRLDRIVEFAELGNFIDTPVKHYSSGMYVRLGFAVAIHTDPDIMLVDEVLAVGDASFQRKCMRSIEEFRRRGGTLLLVSHDLNTMQSICDRLLWIEDGVVQLEGNPTDVTMAYAAYSAKRDEERKKEKEKAATEQANDEDMTEAEKIESAPQRWGSGLVQITKVELCDRNGVEHSAFANGDPMTIRLHYKSQAVVEKPVFGIAIYHQSGTHLTGPNTKFAGLDIPSIEGEGKVEYNIPSLSLLPGNYSISVAVVNQHDTETFDFHDRTTHFFVIQGQSSERYGILTLNGQWQNGSTIERQTNGYINGKTA